MESPNSIEAWADQIGQKLQTYIQQNKRLFVSSSFQSHSLPLLHIISRFAPSVPVYFLHTGFHFPETIAFRHQIASQFGLTILDARSPVSLHGQRDEQGKFFFVQNPDHCCYLNKVLPMEPVIQAHDIWINGVRRDQTKFRAGLQEEESLGDGKLRYHPMLDWTSKMVWEYRQVYHLPDHPLEAKGYLSIGCMPCTRSFEESQDARGARWAGQKKEECGIQTEFVKTAQSV